jgi:hypothetical protein
MQDLWEPHLITVKHILLYMHGTVDLKLFLEQWVQTRWLLLSEAHTRQKYMYPLKNPYP